MRFFNLLRYHYYRAQILFFISMKNVRIFLDIGKKMNIAIVSPTSFFFKNRISLSILYQSRYIELPRELRAQGIFFYSIIIFIIYILYMYIRRRGGCMSLNPSPLPYSFSLFNLNDI